MKNWAGNIIWNPAEVAYPQTEAEIQELVLRAANEGKQVRVIGTGHSFTALCKTDDVVVSLDQYQGLREVNKEKVQARVKAGTKLSTLGALLFQQGMAMENLGDIDVQSIAGTISTGTHGTGTAFGTISTQVIALRFVNGKGEIVTCSETENQELFKAAQVSLGCLGIITEVSLQCVPLYKLEIFNRAESLEAIFANLPERLADNRNFEFYWLPYTDQAISKTTNLIENSEVNKDNFFNYWSEYILENLAFKVICDLGTWFPSRTEAISRFTARAVSDVRKVQYSHKVYATQRLVKFREMEYNVPAEAYLDVWKEMNQAMDTHKFRVHFPVENRWVKGDDILMSPAFQRDSAYLACHVYHKKDHRPYFKKMEEIFRAHGGRPHWGKMHTLNARDIADLYPAFPTFLKHRSEQDPNQIFLSPYMKGLLGLESKVKMISE